jgi:glycine dehydrogenase
MTLSLDETDRFVSRHIGPSALEQKKMLQAIGVDSLDALIDQTIPASIRAQKPLNLPPGKSERALLELAAKLGGENRVVRSFIGMGYSDCVTPPVILRNILQNPGWYTQYTPYQAEISQGRLEALLNYQTMVCDLTALPVANASLLDEGTAAAEAMALAHAFRGTESKRTFFVSDACHPQTIEVVVTRAEVLGLRVTVGSLDSLTNAAAIGPYFGVLLQYPDTRGTLADHSALAERVHAAEALLVVAADILALMLLTPPGEFGADVAVGSTQRFGVPLGYGGPHAAYFATKQDFVRRLPGRIIGVSEDAEGKTAIRMALQTREQHIRREKATSNICTAQALLAIVASMYAVYHGPEGLRKIAGRVHAFASAFALGVQTMGLKTTTVFFDTVTVQLASAADADKVVSTALAANCNLRRLSSTEVSVAFDETCMPEELQSILAAFGSKQTATELAAKAKVAIPEALARKSAVLTHPVWTRHHSETDMLRYMRTLESRDLSLAHSMIPLGSCTMKLNATAEMMPITDAHWNRMHPFAPKDQAQGYAKMLGELSDALAECTGFPGVSLQPNAGSQGEYAGLLAIRGYQESIGQKHRTVCLIPNSAHGTNPASAVMAGMEVVVVACDERGNVDLADLEAKAIQYKDTLGALMVTYPSTHGVFEAQIQNICALVHKHGGQVYMDGANMNAQVGLTSPAAIGADVCHLNLHKTFCIPHGGGGPGMGPICVAKHLIPFLPRQAWFETGESKEKPVGPVSAAPFGSASILLISWAYVHMMGGEGLTEATRVAILNANYIASRLAPHYPVVYQGDQGRIAHECILDMRSFKKSAGIEVEDIAKRLMDYGFHAPTMSFPIPGTLMIEPTESESLPELDRFCEAMISIREEIRAVEDGRLPKDNNPLKNAPHTLKSVTQETWTRPYSRQLAAFPAPWTVDRKFFPAVARINNALGDRKLICTCPPMEAYV